MIQILSLRPKTIVVNGEQRITQSDNEHYAKRWRVENPEEIFADPIGILNRLDVPEDERWNLFYTLSYCGEGKRVFGSQNIMPIDIDGVDLTRLDELEATILDVLGVDANKTAVVASGNGLHIIIKMRDTIVSQDYFDSWKPQYKALLRRIDAAMERKKLPGRADPAIFDKGRILRFPGTENRKIDKKTGQLIIKRCVVRRSTLIEQNFDLEKVSGLKKVAESHMVSEDFLRRMRQTDGNAAFSECGFLKHVKEDAENLTEQEWYAGACVIGHFKNGREQFHAVSKPYAGYSEAETDFKLEQALKNSRPRTCHNINSIWGKCNQCPHFNKITSPVQIYSREVIPSESTGFYDLLVGANGAPKQIPNYNDLLRAFKRDYTYFYCASTGRIFVFDKTHWRIMERDFVRGYSEKMFVPPPIKETQRKEFEAKITANSQRWQNEVEDFFTKTIDKKINVKNGVLDVTTGELSPHSPDYGFQYVLPYEYDPNAKAPRFEQFLKEITCNRQDRENILLDFMGYMLLPTWHHSFLWLVGGGRNGKSTFMEVLRHVVGKQNCDNIPLSRFSDQNYMASLDGKLLNLSDEAIDGQKDAAGIEQLKNITGGGTIKAAKKYGHPFDLKTNVKFLLSSNQRPQLPVSSDPQALISRMRVVPFEMRLEDFRADNGADSKADIKILDKLLAELPGILNLAIARIKAQGEESFKMPHTEETLTLAKEMVEDVDNLESWFIENATLDDTSIVATMDLYNDYKNYCEESGLRARSKQRFTKDLCEKFRALIHQKGANGARQIRGISLLNDLKKIKKGAEF